MSARPGTEILDVLMSMFSGSKDEYGKEEVPPLPLSFDRVNEGRPPRSSSQLLNLPTEILAVITRFVESNSLASLALVNSDCLQLARSLRFASIKLDYSDTSLHLLNKLLDEGRRRLRPCLSDSGTSVPSIGACVRRITVSTHPGWVSYRHGVSLGEEYFTKLPESDQTERMVEASQAFFKQYIPRIEAILNSVILPHLELLDWEDQIALPQSFFETLALSTVKHLKLFRATLDYQFSIALKASLATYRWPLQTLYLELNQSIRRLGDETMSTCPLSRSILRLCSPTLVGLTLTTTLRNDPYTFIDADNEGLPQFPSLRRLNLGFLILNDTSILEALVTDSLRYLEVGSSWSPTYKDFFERRGQVSSLEAFVWQGPEAVDLPLTFLGANNQITKLAFVYDVSSTLLETRILPLLTDHFGNLTSLQLLFEGTLYP